MHAKTAINQRQYIATMHTGIPAILHTFHVFGTIFLHSLVWFENLKRLDSYWVLGRTNARQVKG